jgi:hypothetical protein
VSKHIHTCCPRAEACKRRPLVSWRDVSMPPEPLSAETAHFRSLALTIAPPRTKTCRHKARDHRNGLVRAHSEPIAVFCAREGTEGCPDTFGVRKLNPPWSLRTSWKSVGRMTSSRAISPEFLSVRDDAVTKKTPGVNVRRSQ